HDRPRKRTPKRGGYWPRKAKGESGAV
ncbi:RNA pyrophosphohydrolase, partial [Stenotrophomonas maltophilia]